MFLKNNRNISKSIRARIAIFVSCAVMTGAECVLAQKPTTAKNPPRNEAPRNKRRGIKAELRRSYSNIEMI